MLVLIRGASGSGKTTLAKTLFKDLKHLEADMFFTQSDGSYHFQREYLLEAHAWCQAETYRNLALGKSVVVSNTFTRLWELKKYLQIAAIFETAVGVHHCKRKFQNVHGVPDEVVQRMLKNYEPFKGEFTHENH